jgi:hypothetical protein
MTGRGVIMRVIGWTVAGLLAVVTAAGIGVAFAGPAGNLQAAGEGEVAVGTPTPTATAPGPDNPSEDNPGRHGREGRFPHGKFGRFGGMGRGMLHGEFVVKGEDGKITTMVTQHGTVTAVSATSVSLKSEDGFTGTYAVNNDTRVRVGGGPGAIGGVKTGNEAWVVASKSGSTSTAKALVVKS